METTSLFCLEFPNTFGLPCRLAGKKRSRGLAIRARHKGQALGKEGKKMKKEILNMRSLFEENPLMKSYGITFNLGKS